MNVLILILSILIYASFGLTNLVYILFSALTTFFAAKYGKGKKPIVILTIVANLAILVFLKVYFYAENFGLSLPNILVPIGVSYYTMQVISYLVDVYKGKYEAQQSLGKYLMYVIYIPYLIIGPINRYDQISESLYAKKKWDTNRILNGGIRILWGAFKKLVIAGRLSMILAVITADTTKYTGAYALLAMLLYSIQLYADFSGGIDIVIGVSKLFGINMKENFDAPYLAQNLKEFWRRWHIGLSSWLKDYVYIPLGGNRKGKLRTKINVVITFVVSGLWHGANYLLWGLIHGICVAFPQFLTTKWKYLNRVINYLVVSFTWAFFIWPTTKIALQMMGSVFTNWNYGELFTNLSVFGLDIANSIVLVISILALAIFDTKKDKIILILSNKKVATKLAIIGTVSMLVLIFGIYGIGFEVNDFIYSRF